MPELTFSQRQLMNRARKFVTMKMKKRMELRQTKKSKKDKAKMRKLLSEQLLEKIKQQFAGQGFDVQQEEGADGSAQPKLTFKLERQEEPEKEAAQETVLEAAQESQTSDTGNLAAEKDQELRKKLAEKPVDAGSTGSDDVITIQSKKVKTRKRKSKA